MSTQKTPYGRLLAEAARLHFRNLSDAPLPPLASVAYIVLCCITFFGGAIRITGWIGFYPSTPLQDNLFTGMFVAVGYAYLVFKLYVIKILIWLTSKKP